MADPNSLAEEYMRQAQDYDFDAWADRVLAPEVDCDLPLNFHPPEIGDLWFDTPIGAG